MYGISDTHLSAFHSGRAWCLTVIAYQLTVHAVCSVLLHWKAEASVKATTISLTLNPLNLLILN